MSPDTPWKGLVPCLLPRYVLVVNLTLRSDALTFKYSYYCRGCIILWFPVCLLARYSCLQHLSVRANCCPIQLLTGA